MKNVTVIETDSKKAQLTVSGKKDVKIKLCRFWDDAQRKVVVDKLTSVANIVLDRNIGYTLRGHYNPDYPKIIQLKSSNKKSPKVMNLNFNDQGEARVQPA